MEPVLFTGVNVMASLWRMCLRRTIGSKNSWPNLVSGSNSYNGSGQDFPYCDGKVTFFYPVL